MKHFTVPRAETDTYLRIKSHLVENNDRLKPTNPEYATLLKRKYYYVNTENATAHVVCWYEKTDASYCQFCFITFINQSIKLDLYGTLKEKYMHLEKSKNISLNKSNLQNSIKIIKS